MILTGMKPAYTVAAALAIIGFAIFWLGSFFLGRFIFNLRLMFTLAIVGAFLVTVAAVLALVTFVRHLRNR